MAFFVEQCGTYFAKTRGYEEQFGEVTMWRAWMTGILGIWLIVASFTLSGNIMNQLIVGVAITVLGFWSAIRM